MCQPEWKSISKDVCYGFPAHWEIHLGACEQALSCKWPRLLNVVKKFRCVCCPLLGWRGLRIGDMRIIIVLKQI